MTTHREPHHREPQDDNAELHQIEPLRIVLAIGALLLGLALGIH